MTDEKEVLKVIYEVIDLHNGANSESYFIEKKLDTPIFSKNSNLDSLVYANLPLNLNMPSILV